MTTFPEFHPLHIFNDFVYMDAGSPRYPVYIFRWDKENGTILGLAEAPGYFKATVKPIIFTDDYNWTENDKKPSYAFDNIDKVVTYFVVQSKRGGAK